MCCVCVGVVVICYVWLRMVLVCVFGVVFCVGVVSLLCWLCAVDMRCSVLCIVLFWFVVLRCVWLCCLFELVMSCVVV